MFSLPPGNLKPTYLAPEKLDESLLSDSHMADGVEVTATPSLPLSVEHHSVHTSDSDRGLLMLFPF